MPQNKLDVVLKEYIEMCPDFEHLQDDDKIFIYSSLKKILSLLHLVIKYPNVHAILFVQSIKTKQIIEEAFENTIGYQFSRQKNHRGKGYLDRIKSGICVCRGNLESLE